MARNTDLGIQMAALLLALLLPLILFILFQRQFLAGVALSGDIKE
jgi:multiple sugar transport system permease protein